MLFESEINICRCFGIPCNVCVYTEVCLLFVHNSRLSPGSCMLGLIPVNEMGLKLILILRQELGLELAALMW